MPAMSILSSEVPPAWGNTDPKDTSFQLHELTRADAQCGCRIFSGFDATAFFLLSLKNDCLGVSVLQPPLECASDLARRVSRMLRKGRCLSA